MAYSLFVVLGLLTGPVLVWTQLTCTDEYRKISSTICLGNSPIFTSGGVSDADIETILNVHNDLRSNVSPTSSNMLKPVWDKNLASLAQVWVQQCASGHDTFEAKTIIEYNGLTSGQNAASGQADWTEVVNAWYSEVKDFAYGQTTSRGIVGHYTQVVRGDVSRIGCGFANCKDGYNRHYVCNYIVGNGQGVGTSAKPYKKGPSCGDCGSHCHGGKLCDCGGLLCFNGGELNLAGCTCMCKNVWEGRDCMTKNCDAVGADPSSCGKEQPYGYPKSSCKKFSNAKDECPRMCNDCPAGISPAAGAGAPPQTATGESFGTFPFQAAGGRAGNNQNCAAMPADPRHCGKAQPYGYPTDFCDLFTNVPEECPRMCCEHAASKL